MPIKIPNALPATRTLEEENIFVMTETRALSQDIRPLKILLLNLMPKKIETETQLSRLLGNSPLQVEFELIHTKFHISKNTSQEHLLAFYNELNPAKQEELIDDINKIDFSLITRVYKEINVQSCPARDVTPMKATDSTLFSQEERDKYIAIGNQAIADGKVKFERLGRDKKQVSVYAAD